MLTTKDFELSNYQYALSEEFIAQTPLKERDESLICVVQRRSGRITKDMFLNIHRYLEPGDLLVFNKTKVIPARFLGYKETGGKVDILFIQKLSDTSFIGKSRAKGIEGKKIKVGEFILSVKRNSGKIICDVLNGSVDSLMKENGLAPLPPYIKRKPNRKDLERYQSIFAEVLGSIAAPTAGLHFTERVFKNLKDKSIRWAYLVLHIGEGTFAPLKTSDIREHSLESEFYYIPEGLLSEIYAAKERGKRVIGVGTTVVRALENWAITQKKEGSATLFIYPSFKFRVVDGIITNFHLPCSTPLLLVSAFAGRKLILSAYEKALMENFRFLSYGDAMLLL